MALDKNGGFTVDDTSGSMRSEGGQAEGQATASPGWYPVDSTQMRWWDGRHWTDQTRPMPEPPSAPRKSVAKHVLIACGVVLAVSITIGAVVDTFGMATHNEETVSQQAISDRADGCNRFVDFIVQSIDERWNNQQAAAHARGLRDAARGVDDLLASDMNDIVIASNAADVSATGQIVLRRCDAGGYISDEQRQRVGEAAARAAQ